jgi:hypothetical protein
MFHRYLRQSGIPIAIFFFLCVYWCVWCVSTLGDKLGKLGQGMSRVWCVGVPVAWKLQSPRSFIDAYCNANGWCSTAMDTISLSPCILVVAYCRTAPFSVIAACTTSLDRAISCLHHPWLTAISPSLAVCYTLSSWSVTHRNSDIARTPFQQNMNESV